MDEIVPVVPTITPPSNTGLPAGVPPAGNPPQLPAGASNPPAPAPAAQPAPVPTNVTANTGSAALDAAINVLASTAGATDADLQRIAGNALQYGDVNLIDRAFLQEKFGKHAAQFEALAIAAVQEQKNATNRAASEVHALAGGEAQWNQAVAVFNQSAPDPIRAAVRALIDSGNTQQGAQLLIEMVRGSGLVPNVNPLVSGGAAVPSSQGALGKAEFQSEMAKLKNEAGNRSLETGVFAERYQQLLQRRAQGRALGY